MSHEQFDKKIRDKLLAEQEPTFSPTDWERFEGKYAPPTPASGGWGSWVRPLGVLTAAAVIGVLVYKNVVQSQENAKIRYEMAQLQQKLEQQQRQNTASSQPDFSTSSAASNATTTEMPKNMPPPSMPQVEPSKSASTNGNSAISTIKSTKMSDKKPVFEVKNLENKEKSNTAQLAENRLMPTTQENFEQNRIANPAKTLENEAIVQQSRLNIELLKGLNISLQNEVAKLDWSGVQLASLPPRVFQNLPPKQGLGNINIGISGAVGRNMTSAGLSLGWQFMRNFSLQTGIERVNIERGKFDDDRDFDRQTKREFRQMFEQGVPATTSFKKIEFESEFWQIPLTLQYRTPRFKGFSLLATAGVAFNVESQNRFEYEYETPTGSDAEGVLRQTDKNVGVLDQISAGIGIQKDWRAWTLQVIPTFQSPLTARPDSTGKPNIPNPNPSPRPEGNHPSRDFGFSPLHVRLRLAYNF